MCRSTAQGGRRCTGGHASTSTTAPSSTRTYREALNDAGLSPMVTPYLVTALARQAQCVKDGRDGGSFDSEVELGRDLLRSSGRTSAQIDAIELAWRAER